MNTYSNRVEWPGRVGERSRRHLALARSHPDAADRRAQRHVVDDNDRLNPRTGTQEGHYGRAQVIRRPASAAIVHLRHLVLLVAAAQGRWPPRAGSLAGGKASLSCTATTPSTCRTALTTPWPTSAFSGLPFRVTTPS